MRNNVIKCSEHREELLYCLECVEALEKIQAERIFAELEIRPTRRWSQSVKGVWLINDDDYQELKSKYLGVSEK